MTSLAPDHLIAALLRRKAMTDLAACQEAGVNADWFSGSHRDYYAFIEEHAEKYGEIPGAVAIEANYPQLLDGMPKPTESFAVLLDEFVRFHARNSLIASVSDSIEALDSDDLDKAMAILRSAVDAGVVRATGQQETSWHPIKASEALSGNKTGPQPTLLMRDDGHGLFYRGLTHAIFGESGGGKSWIGVAICNDALIREPDLPVLYIDCESYEGLIYGRFYDLGWTTPALDERVWYVRPSDELDKGAFNELLSMEFSAIVIDGWTPAMALVNDGDSNRSDDVNDFLSSFVEPLATQCQAAVVIIDHIPKGRDANTSYAIGSERKRSGLTGAAYRLEVTHRLTHGDVGSFRLINTKKDRPGQVIRFSPPLSDGTNLAAFIDIDATKKPYEVHVLSPDISKMITTDTIAGEIEQYVRQNPGCTKDDITKNVSGSTEAKRERIEALAQQGRLLTMPGRRKDSFLYTIAEDITGPDKAEESEAFPPSGLFPPSVEAGE